MNTDYAIRSENNKPTLCLYYFRNGIETLFPVSSLDHALRLADAIADSDLLNENVEWNLINLAEYDPNTGKSGDDWYSDCGESFRDIWDEWKDKELT